jgi:hypothetical protein
MDLGDSATADRARLDRIRNELADRYMELIELAGCSPDSPHLAVADLPKSERVDGAARWLAIRLAKQGHRVTITECREAADAYWTRLHTAPRHEVGRRMRL